MSTVKAPALAAPLSLFAQFTAADVKGGEHAHAYRKTVVRAALEQAFKGNYSPLTEALGTVAGKSKKSRAYLAGFAAAGVSSDPAQSTVRKVPYKGALSGADNADARAEIERRTAEAFNAFFAAFDTVMAEPPKPKKAKDDAATGAAAAGPESNADAGDVATGGEVVESVSMDVATVVESIVSAINAGMLDGAELAAIRAALASYDAAQSAALATAEATAEAPEEAEALAA